MGGQLAKEQEQLKNLNCKLIELFIKLDSQWKGASEALQEFQQDW